ncbi:Os04g0190500 [Oryza sativa Japonica Group]|uniref:OSJNBa0059D20.3 protein n=1 Tax=Oryza sativa subsp. japonica TaxID=39947 RepID=Q7X803_ORYSJ|nr:Os04g0190500 [Oryza sativa Japonica Group]CAD39765.2 OSJNBa0059D20.3 [Oryza sativa Japonica Group]|eukprot:NP_001173778.1 Os04g0190500 [Oryza sativa Japonica Group]
MRFVNRPSITETEFPRLEPTVNDDGEELTHRRCTSYGEYASTPTDAGAKLSAELLKDWFCNFYEGFQKDARVWFLYGDSTLLENPWDFRFEDINNDRYQKPRKIFLSAITPCILPVGIHQGRNIQVSYEFYHPMSSARQFGMGNLLIGLFFADKIQCRGEISSSLMMDRLLNLQGPPLGSIDTTKLATFRSKAFDRWWTEWKLHLFHQSASMYMTDLFPDILPQTTESSPPHQSNSGRDIEYAPGLIPNRDPSIEKALDEENIEDDVDQAAAELPPPPSSPVQQSLSDRTPSAVGSHHIVEEEQPAAPAIPASSLDSLVVDCGSIRAQLHEVQALIPEELADVLTPAAYLEQHQFKLEKAKLRLSECREHKEIEAAIQVNRQLVHEEKVKLDQLSEGPIKSNIDRLEARKINLLAQLEECNAELDMEHKKLADLPKSVEQQKARLKSAIKNVADLTKSLKVISRTDAQDAQAIEEVEQIRQRAILAIQWYLSQYLLCNRT